MSPHAQDVTLALICAFTAAAILAYLILTAAPTPKPVRECRKCAGHGWIVSAGWARSPWETCPRCHGTRVES